MSKPIPFLHLLVKRLGVKDEHSNLLGGRADTEQNHYLASIFRRAEGSQHLDRNQVSGGGSTSKYLVGRLSNS